MPRFPRSTAGVLRLAEEVITGLKNLARELPAPPVSYAQLTALVSGFQTARHESLQAEGVAAAKRKARVAALKELVEALKATLAYGMSMLRGNRLLLGQLGWAWPRARQKLEAPGQAYKLRIVAEGPSWIELAWSAPGNGGAVAGYQIRRRQARQVWENVGTAIEPECRLENQPRGVELEYHVLAMNRAGTGMESGVVEAVL